MIFSSPEKANEYFLATLRLALLYSSKCGSFARKIVAWIESKREFTHTTSW